MRSEGIGILAGLGATAIWAGNFIAARALADQIPPIQFNFWRWVVALIVILPFGLKHLPKDWSYARNNFGYLSLMAILGVTLMNSFIYKAGQTTESLNMALIMPFTPAAIVILARFLYGEKISWQRGIGITIATAGIFILICRGSWERLASWRFQNGDFWTLGCMLCFALYSLFMRKRSREVSNVGFNILVFALGIVYTSPLVVAELVVEPLPEFNYAAIIGILYSGVGCSAMAFWLWTAAIDKLGPVKAGIIYYTLPFFAAIMANVVLGEKVTLAQGIGGFMIIFGVLSATLRPRASRGRRASPN